MLPIFIAGTGRSGTTWLLDILSSLLKAKVTFEPLHPSVPNSELLNRRYFMPDQSNLIKENKLMTSVLKGEIQNKWTQQRKFKIIPRYFKLKSNNLIIKEIRANLLLDWLVHNFDCKIVFIVRHPCAVICSRYERGWDDHLEELVSQDLLVKNHLEPYVKFIQSLSTPIEKQTALWCIENKIPLKQLLGKQNFICCTYEQLCVDTYGTINRILDALNFNLKNKLNQEQLNQISHTSSKNISKLSYKELVSRWQKKIARNDLEDVQRVLNAFDIKFYNVDDVMPRFDLLDSKNLGIEESQAVESHNQDIGQAGDDY